MHNHEELHRQVQQVQLDATKEALAAKRDFEIDEQRRKVEAIAQQVYDRVTHLLSLANEVKYDMTKAPDERVNYPAGAFHGDTATIDGLLEVLSKESALLDNMRAAKTTTEEMATKYEGRLDEIQSAADGSVARVFEMPSADQPEPVTSGIYM